MTNARDFTNIIERAVRPKFQHIINSVGIKEHNIETDGLLLDLLNDTFKKSPIKYSFHYMDDRRMKGSDKVLDSMNIYSAFFNQDTLDIEVIFLPGFSKHFFADGKTNWRYYSNNLKQLIQHEKMHYVDISKIPKDKLTVLNLGSTIDFSDDPIVMQNDSDRLMAYLTKKNIPLTKVLSMYNSGDVQGYEKLVRAVTVKYKTPDKLKEFMELFFKQAYALTNHIDNPFEVRAVAQEIIVDFFRKGLNKNDILDIVRSDVKNTPSQRYNGLLTIDGSNSQGLKTIRLEIGKIISQLE